MQKRGMTAEEIVKHYYTGVDLAYLTLKPEEEIL